MALDYTVTFAGLTIGAGTSFPILNLDGIETLPDVRSGDLDRGYQDGQTPGLDLLTGRDITVDLLVMDSGVGDYFANVEKLKAATVPQASEFALVYQLPSRNPRTLNVRARRRLLPVTPNYSFRYGQASILLHATDPRIYDASFTTLVTGLPTAATGLTFNAPAPFVFGSAGTGGSVLATNAGNYPAPWVATLAGPLTNPSIIRLDTGQTILWNSTLNVGETLVIDSLARSVLLNGTTPRYSATTGQWFTLPVGNTTVQFSAVSGTGTMSFAYRSTWV
jgi:hypothetical protein